MTQNPVIPSGMIASRSDAIVKSKDPVLASLFAADAMHSLPTLHGSEEFPETTFSAAYRKGSFDYAGLRIANSRSAEDDNAVANQS